MTRGSVRTLATSVVDDHDVKRFVGHRAHAHAHRRGLGVPEHVVERLLDDAEGGLTHRGWDRLVAKLQLDVSL